MPEKRSRRGGARPGAGRPRKYEGMAETISFAGPPGLAQQIGGDGQKYLMEWDIRCPDDKTSKPAGASSAAPGGSAKGEKK